MSKLEDTVEPILSESSGFDLQVHILKNKEAYIHLIAEKKDLLLLDQMTSRVIRHGGTLQT